MSESTRALILLILIIILLLVLAFYGQGLMMKRALRSVIKLLRDHQALTPESAKYLDEIGMKRKSFLQLKAFRDYKPAAIQFLQRQEIILITEEGRIYLSEEKLYQTGIEGRIGKNK
jgi:hypothetical protein